MNRDSHKLRPHYKGLVINELYTMATMLCDSFPMSPACACVNVILCRACFFSSLETLVLEDRMSLSNTARIVYGRRYFLGVEQEEEKAKR
jgi:hypothetical protein